MDETLRYKVVVNHEEQYSLWPGHLPNAPGWRDEGMSGSKPTCARCGPTCGR